MLTRAGVTLCALASVLVYFEYRERVALLLGRAIVFVIGSILDILDGALARAGGKATSFGAFLDSTTDRVGEAFMLGAIALAFVRDGNETAFLFTFAAMAGSFLVSYTRSKAETLGLKGDVGIGSRAERVVVIASASWSLRGAGCSGRSTCSPRPRGSPSASASGRCVTSSWRRPKRSEPVSAATDMAGAAGIRMPREPTV